MIKISPTRRPIRKYIFTFYSNKNTLHNILDFNLLDTARVSITYNTFESKNNLRLKNLYLEKKPCTQHRLLVYSPLLLCILGNNSTFPRDRKTLRNLKTISKNETNFNTTTQIHKNIILNSYKKELLFKSMMKSQFSYYPLIWMFCSRKANNPINSIQERSLRLITNDKTSTFEHLLQANNEITTHQRNLQVLMVEVLK